MFLCERFRKEAGRVWNEMSAAQRLGLSLSEETITETCLFNLARKTQTGQIAIIPATRPQEAKHGADWEWWFTNSGWGVGYRVQAKRLFPSGRYESLFKPGEQFAQLDKLVSKAGDDGIDPLYCFYNFQVLGSPYFAAYNICPHDYRGVSYWGCSLALPEVVKSAHKDSFSSLQPFQVPWHNLVCSKDNKDVPNAVIANIQEMTRRGAYRSPGREEVDRIREPRRVPAYVNRLAMLGWLRREQPSTERAYIDREYWELEAESLGEDIAGVLVIDERG